MESFFQVMLYIWMAVLLIIIGTVVLSGLLLIGIFALPFIIIAGIFG
jgi:hypothetical protein